MDQKPVLERRDGVDPGWASVFRKNNFCERYCGKFYIKIADGKRVEQFCKFKIIF